MKQFDNALLRNFYKELGIKIIYLHQSRLSTKIIKHMSKAKLDILKGRWVEELSIVLSYYHTTVRTNIGEFPFSLAFGVEAVIPLEIGISSFFTAYNEIEIEE